MKRRWMKMLFRVTGSLMAPVLIAVASLAQSSSSPALQKAEEAYSNIQVLKGIPAEHVIPNMDFFAASLGVSCEYCHVAARDKDDKPPKETTRRMIQMVRALNKDNFGGRSQITCFTCHRGSTSPVAGTPDLADASFQPPAPDRPGGNPGGQEAAGPAADQLLDKYVQALGGMEAIKKISTRIVKATVTDSTGQSVGMEVISKAPDRGISVTHQGKVDVIAAYDGDSGWRRAGAGLPNNQVRDIRTYELDDIRFRDQLYFVTHLKEVLSQLRTVRSEKVADQDAYVVRGTAWSRVPVRLYFDKNTGNLIRIVYFEEFELGQIPTQIDLADYRDADGAKFPYRWTIAQPASYQSVRIDQVQQNVVVDDSKFSKPASPKL